MHPKIKPSANPLEMFFQIRETSRGRPFFSKNDPFPFPASYCAPHPKQTVSGLKQPLAIRDTEIPFHNVVPIRREAEEQPSQKILDITKRSKPLFFLVGSSERSGALEEMDPFRKEMGESILEKQGMGTYEEP